MQAVPPAVYRFELAFELTWLGLIGVGHTIQYYLAIVSIQPVIHHQDKVIVTEDMEDVNMQQLMSSVRMPNVRVERTRVSGQQPHNSDSDTSGSNSNAATKRGRGRGGRGGGGGARK